MVPTFNSLNELFAHIKQQLADTMNDEVAHVVKFEEQRQIERVVYDAYPEPYVYERRMYNDGGLQDIEMMVSEIQKTSDGVILSVVNMAKGQDQEDLYIAPLVEYGHNSGHGSYQYTYNRSHDSWRYLQSRPFTEATVEALSRSGKHVQALKEGMKKRGINIE